MAGGRRKTSSAGKIRKTRKKQRFSALAALANAAQGLGKGSRSRTFVPPVGYDVKEYYKSQVMTTPGKHRYRSVDSSAELVRKRGVDKSFIDESSDSEEDQPSSSAHMEVDEGRTSETLGPMANMRGGKIPVTDASKVKDNNPAANTTVDLLDQFSRWQRTCHAQRLTDEQLAKFLLDRYYEVDKPESECTNSHGNQKAILIEEELLMMWNNVKSANGISSDRDFLCYLLLALLKSGQGAEMLTSIMQQQESSTVVMGHATSVGCVPVKVHYVGPAHARSDSSQDLNCAANTSLTLQQSPQCVRPRKQVLAPAIQEPVFSEESETLGDKAAEKKTTEVGGASRVALHGDKQKNPNDAQLPDSAKSGKEALELREQAHICTKDSEKHSSNNGNTDTPSQLRTVRIHVKEEEEVEMDLGDCSNDVSSHLSYKLEKEFGNCEITDTSSQISCHTGNITVKAEAEEEANRWNCDVTLSSRSSQMPCDAADINLKTEDSQQKDLGSCDSTSPASQLSYTTVGSDINKEVELEDEDDFEETEEELSSSEEEEKREDSLQMSTAEEGDSDESEEKGDSDEFWYPGKVPKKKRQRRKKRRQKKWTCKCREEFNTESLLNKHKVEVHPKMCQYCEENFSTTETLNKHLKTHKPSRDKLNLNGNVMALCDFCGKFFSKWTMKSHQVTHSEERPYKCDVDGCKSAFKQKQALQKHMNYVHSGLVSCSFEGCEKVLSSKSRMKQHFKLHAGKRSHLCSYCGKTFQRQDHLKVHLRIHTGDLPYTCSLCNYSGRQYNSLRWHMKSQHPEQAGNSGGNKDAASTEGLETEEGGKVAAELRDASVDDSEGTLKKKAKRRCRQDLTVVEI